MSILTKLFPKATARPWHQNDRMQAAIVEVAREVVEARTDREFSEGVRALFSTLGLPEEVGLAAIVHAVNHFDALVAALEALVAEVDKEDLERDGISLELEAMRERAAATLKAAREV